MRSTKDFGLAAGFAVPCDLCGNDTLFTAVSDRLAEDLCELRVICRCGFDRAETHGVDGIESVMGELTQESITAAFHVTWGARPLACSRFTMSEKAASRTSVRDVVRRDDPFDIASLTDEQIVERGLELARTFYKAHGYEVAEGFKFYDSQHPQEQGMWNLACIAFEELTGTDLNDALANIGE